MSVANLGNWFEAWEVETPMAHAEKRTFKDFDKFGLKPFADKLADYLLTEYRFVDGSYVLSLNSEFGSGKTTFLEMWRNELASTEGAPGVVYLNAWESDYQGDPLLALVSALLSRFETEDVGEKAEVKTEKVESIKETAGKLCRFGLSIGNDVVRKATGIDFIKAGEHAEHAGHGAEAEAGHACFESYREKQGLFQELRSLLTDLTGEPSSPTFVFVDELDRCRPTYAIEFLETIKHFFDIEGLVFVLGVDKKQLASSSRSLFGQQLDFDEYYRKFAHRNVTLPVKSVDMTKRFCTSIVREYFSEEAYAKKGLFPHIRQDQDRTEDVVELCLAFSLNARQIHELFRTAAHVFSATSKTESPLSMGWHIAALFMAALTVRNEDTYHRLGRRKISLEEFTSCIKGLPLWVSVDRTGFWWAALLYLGAFGKEPMEKLEKEFEMLGVWSPSGQEKEAFKTELGQIAEAYGRSARRLGDVFPMIYEIMEGLKTFAER